MQQQAEAERWGELLQKLPNAATLHAPPTRRSDGTFLFQIRRGLSSSTGVVVPGSEPERSRQTSPAGSVAMRIQPCWSTDVIVLRRAVGRPP